MSFKIGKNKMMDDKFIEFCEILNLNIDKLEAKDLFNYFKSDCDEMLTKYINNRSVNGANDVMCSSDFCVITMACILLLQDHKPPYDLLLMGTDKYTGKNDPYDYSWFEGVGINKADKTTLEYMQDLYKTNKKFVDMFDNVFLVLEECCDDYQKIEDALWSFYADTSEIYDELYKN